MRSILLKRLERLPPGLEKIYEELYEYNMHELGEEQAEVVKKILSWLLVAKIPLCTSELCQLVCAPGEADMSIETVLDMTFDLVRLDAVQDQFRFSHLSVREYLEKRNNEFVQIALHSMATRACLSLLTRHDPIKAENYATTYWLAHAEDATKNGGGSMIEQQLNTFLQTRNSHFIKWNDMALQAQRKIDLWTKSAIEQRLSKVLVKGGNPLLITACFALPTQLQRIISDVLQPVDIDLKNETGESGLYLASQYGSVESAQLLLKKGADVNAQGGLYGNALQAASEGDHAEIVQLLLDKGADINA